MSERYVVIKAMHLGQMEKAVKEKMLEGLDPTGGPFRIPADTGPDWWGQALYEPLNRGTDEWA